MVDLHFMTHKYGLLPKGLNELMNDISREVLRAQPDDINAFVASYLGALLDARTALTTADDVCEDISTRCYRIVGKKETNPKENSSVYEHIISKEKEEANAKKAIQETNELQNTIDARHSTQEVLQERPSSSCVEAQEYFKYRQYRDFWSHSVFSLPGSYMNLPASQPYSVYDSITTASKPSSKRDHSGNSDYIVDRMCDDEDSLT